MYEILPESWRLEGEVLPLAGQSKCPRRGPITDCVFECNGSNIPLNAPHLFTYMQIIVRVSRNFEGTAWVTYDTSFRRAAANKGSLDWGVPDPGGFNDALVGQAKKVPRCLFRLSDTKKADDCSDAPATKQPLSTAQAQADQRVGTSASRQPSGPQQGGRAGGLVVYIAT